MVKNIFEETSSFCRLGYHPNIVNYIAQYKTVNHFYVFIEHCNCGDLESLMNNGLKLGEPEVQYLARELL
jgi:serine/threonine protein kinase